MLEAVSRAFHLLGSGDRELLVTVGASLRFALSSTAVASVGAIPLGALLALRRFPGQRVVTVILHAAMALPTVVVGLVVYSLLSQSGPLGPARLLFTPAAIIIGQAVLAFPIVASMVQGTLGRFDPELRETFVTLGAGGARVLGSVLREAAPGVGGAVLGGFGRVVGEVGVAMMLGGNIRLYTRTMTTAIALETGKGEFERAVALGVVLIVVALAVNAAVNLAAGWTGRRER